MHVFFLPNVFTHLLHNMLQSKNDYNVQRLTWILEFNVQLNPLVSNNAKRINEIHNEQTIHTI